MCIRDRSGIYEVQLTDVRSGCTAVAPWGVLPAANALGRFDLNITKLSCQDSLFLVEVVIQSGEDPALTYQLDTRPGQPYPQFHQVAPGMHHISIRDKAGCVTDSTFTIGVNNDLNVWLDTDTTIYEGDSVWMQVYASQSLATGKINWLVNGSEVGNAKPGFMVYPTLSSEYEVVFTDVNGCQLYARRRIRVLPTDGFYLPNVFTPNGDGKNDYFYIPENPRIPLILSLDIYDRWGNHVFSKSQPLPGDHFSGWDGTFQGREMNPGVFVYKIKYRFKTGMIKEAYGNFVLIR